MDEETQGRVRNWLKRADEYDVNIDHGLLIAPRVIGWERFRSLSFQQAGLFVNLRQDAIELWRRPGTDNPLKTPALTPVA